MKKKDVEVLNPFSPVCQLRELGEFIRFPLIIAYTERLWRSSQRLPEEHFYEIAFYRVN